MIKYLQSMKQDDKEALDRFWSSVESFLITVANISKILWPSSGLSTEVSSRREALRGLLSVNDSSPIRSKTFRNHFEHYDTRIEDWAKQYENKTIIDSNIGPVDSVIIGVNHAVSIMRNFDPYKFIVRLRDQEYDINRVVTAVQDL
jgi:hypothetical protein